MTQKVLQWVMTQKVLQWVMTQKVLQWVMTKGLYARKTVKINTNILHLKKKKKIQYIVTNPFKVLILKNHEI